MKSENNDIAQGRKKLRLVIWGGMSIPGIWTVFDLFISRTGLGFFLFMFLTIGITLGSSMLNGSSSARRLWAIGGFLFTLVLVLGASVTLDGGGSHTWFLLLSALAVFLVTIYSISDGDIKAYMAAEKEKNKVPKVNDEMERLIEDIGTN